MSPSEPSPPAPDHDGDELHRAIEEASESLGVTYRPLDGDRWAQDEAPDRGRWAFRATVVVLVLAIGWAWLGPGASRSLPPSVVEADLRWAVAEVVEAVERHRTRHGRLPAPADLHALAGEHVAYEAEGDTYRVRGRRDGVSVLWDGTLPLEEWRTLALYGEPSGAP